MKMSPILHGTKYAPKMHFHEESPNLIVCSRAAEYWAFDTNFAALHNVDIAKYFIVRNTTRMNDDNGTGIHDTARRVTFHSYVLNMFVVIQGTSGAQKYCNRMRCGGTLRRPIVPPVVFSKKNSCRAQSLASLLHSQA